MLAAVSAALLNVRNMPSASSSVIGQLSKGMVVVGETANEGWMRIQFADTFAFISAHYLQPVNNLQRVVGTVNASSLNVRFEPSNTAKVMASVKRGASIKTLAVINRWLEIEFNGELAYISAEYVDLVYIDSGFYAKVTASSLNVRSAPLARASLFGQLRVGSKIWVESQQQSWSQIRFNGNRGYVASRFIRQTDESEIQNIEAHNNRVEEHEPLIVRADTLNQLARLTPKNILLVRGSTQQRNAAATWNRWGALLQTLSEKKQLDVACVVAVLCVESSGKGFEQNNADRMIIRFENHKFWKFWGKHHPQQYRQHFTYRSGKAWLDHKWRAEIDESWRSFHGRQAAEWEVFEFACQLDKEAAMQSISMGAPQIMGFNFEQIGYQSVVEMFDAFSTSIQGQIEGLFDFFSVAMVRHLRDLAFEDFAASYNGSGQKAVYGQRIFQHYEAFKKMYRA